MLVTYDANGVYGHPDHIQAHRVAWQACEQGTQGLTKFYATAAPGSGSGHHGDRRHRVPRLRR